MWIAGASGVAEEIAPPPWLFGDWDGVDEQGYRLRWQGKQALLAPPDGPYAALTLASAPRSLGVAPPWFAIERSQGDSLVVLLDDLLRIPELCVGGVREVVRPAEVARPTATPAQNALFDALMAQGLLAPLDPVPRDQLLLETFGPDGEIDEAAAARLLAAADSPRAVRHDLHWFEESDGVIARFDAALVGEPVRFVSQGVEGDTARFEVVRGDRREASSAGAFIWETASALDAFLAAGRSTRRIYALDTGHEETFVYVVLTAAEREALVAAGVGGIRSDLEPHFT